MARALRVVLLADARQFSRELDRATGSTHKIGRAATIAGAAIATGLGAFAKIGWDEWSEAAKVTAQTGAAIKSTGGAANVTAGHVQDLAGKIMNLSGMDDEAIQSGENMLLTFRNIRNETGAGNKIFDQSTMAVADMTAAFNAMGKETSATNMALQLGKALNEPAQGISRLQRIGVTFTAKQKELVKGWVEHGKTLKAQKFILAEINKEFGGSAKAAGETLPGKLAIARESFKNMAGAVVGALIPALSTLAKLVGAVAGFLSRHTTVAKVLVGALTLLAGALLAVSAATKVWSAITKVAAASQWLLNAALAANPIILVVAGLVALGAALYVAWKKSETFRKIVTGAWDAIKDSALAVVGAITGMAEDVWGVIEEIGDKIEGAMSTIKGWGASIGSWIKAAVITGVTGVADGAWNILNDIWDKISGAVDTIKGWGSSLGGWIKGAVVSAVTGVAGLVWDQINNIPTKFTAMMATIKDWGAKVGGWIVNSLVAAFTNLGRLIWGKIKAAWDWVKGKLPSLPSLSLPSIHVPRLPFGDAPEGVAGPGYSKLRQLLAFAHAEGFNPTPEQINKGSHAKNSYHYLNRAVDMSGTPAQMRKAFRDARYTFESFPIRELFYDPMGYFIKDGQIIKGAIGGHKDHVHLALGGGGIVTAPTMALIGERGPEAVVPLNRGAVGNVYVTVHGWVGSDQDLATRIGRELETLNRRGVSFAL